MKLYIAAHLLLLLLLMPGCGRVCEWFSFNTNQGECGTLYSCCVRCYLKSTRMYDQIDTVGIFDALWLSDEVRRAYVNMNVYKTGKTKSDRAMMLDDQLAANDNDISFYVLSLTTMPLDERNSKWSVLLCVNGKVYQPREINEVELSPEYQALFGCTLTSFKKPYLVIFDAYAANGLPVLNEAVDKIQLLFRTVEKQTRVTWCLNGEGRACCSNPKACPI